MQRTKQKKIQTIELLQPVQASTIDRFSQFSEKIDWKNGEAVINTLKSWGITDSDQLTAAKAFHRSKLIHFYSMDKAKNDGGMDKKGAGAQASQS